MFFILKTLFCFVLMFLNLSVNSYGHVGRVPNSGKSFLKYHKIHCLSSLLNNTQKVFRKKNKILKHSNKSSTVQENQFKNAGKIL